jgi:hypothetical protein
MHYKTVPPARARAPLPAAIAPIKQEVARMTTNPEISETPDLSALASENLEHRLEKLIRCYVQRRSQDLTHAVVRHLEALCLHPDYDGDLAQRCAYRRLVQHWRWLSQDLRRAAGTRGPSWTCCCTHSRGPGTMRPGCPRCCRPRTAPHQSAQALGYLPQVPLPGDRNLPGGC